MMMRYTENYNLKKPEELDPVDIQDLNYNADAIDGKLKEIEDWEAAHLQTSNPHNITPALIGAETPTGAQQKANQAETNAKSYADMVTNSALNSAKDYADDVLESANSHTDQVASDLSNQAETNAKSYADQVASDLSNQAETNAKSYADIVANGVLNSAKNYADGVLESANSHTDQVASDLSQKLNKTRIKVLDIEQDVSNINKVLINLNPNHEAKQTASGYGTVTLPKNAANGQVSASVKGMTLKNELNYNRDTWAEWTKSTGVTGDSTGLEFTADGEVQKSATLNTKLKTNTKYGIIIEVISGTISGSLRLSSAYTGSSLLIATASIGNKKVIFTTQQTISLNRFEIYLPPTETAGNKIKIRDVRLFELPAGSEIESDFETLTADQLAQKYPYIKGDSVKSTVGAMRIKSVGKNLFDITTFKTTNYENRAYSVIDFADMQKFVGKTLTVSHNVKTGFTQYKIATNYTGVSIKISTSSQFTFEVLQSYVDNKYKLFIGYNPGIIVDYYSLNVQIEIGSTATPYEPYIESTAYVVAKDEEGKIAELRSLPNGVKDEIRVSDGKLIKRVGERVLQETDIYDWRPRTNVNYLIMNKPLNDKMVGYTLRGIVPYRINDYIGSAWNNDTFDDSGNVGKIVNADSNKYAIGFPVTMDETTARNLILNQLLTYQLATPIEIPIQISGSLVSYPSGTVYIEPFVADAGIYVDKMPVLHQDLPIKALEKISKVDFETGVETELDVSETVIAGDKLSFTHPDLTSGDIVFFVYERDKEGTTAEAEIEFYDSRYVIKDSVTEKFYKWHIAVADGVPSIELTEV